MKLNYFCLDSIERTLLTEVRRVRTWRQKRDDVPKRFPYDRYVSKGNRMIVADFAEDTDLRALGFEPAQLSEAQVMRPVGCELCRQIGYKGRMGIFEVFVIDDEVRHMINKRTSTFVLRHRARELGMRTLREDGVRKVLAGLTSAEEVISITVGDVS